MSDNETERTNLIRWLESKLKKAPVASILVIHSGSNRNVDRFEVEPGEPTDVFAARIFEDLKADANAYDSVQIYFLNLFRESQENPEASRPLRISPDDSDMSHFAGDSDRAQSFRHSETFARIMATMSATALESKDREIERQTSRMTRMEDAQWENLERARRVALDMGELEIRKEEARINGAIMTKALEQLELLAPLVMSKLLGQKPDESPGGDVEKRLLKDFFDKLRPEQQGKIMAVLDGVQQIAIMSLAKGEIDPRFEAIQVQRIMAGLTEPQLRDIANICDTAEQSYALEILYGQRRKGLAHVANAARLEVANENPQNGITQP